MGRVWGETKNTIRLNSNACADYGARVSWSGRRESNPPRRLGKPMHYHYATPASGKKQSRRFCQQIKSNFVSFRPTMKL